MSGAPRVSVEQRSADEVIARRLLAAFVREVGGLSPLVRAAAPEVYAELERDGRPMCVDLAASGCQLLVAMTRHSPSGHHDFAGRLVLVAAGNQRYLAGPLPLADALLGELHARAASDPAAEVRRRELWSAISSSVRCTRRFAEAVFSRPSWTRGQGVRRFIEAEQSLVFGHPFHPAPKGGDSSTEWELDAYRPELGASFQLEHFAVSPELLLEDAIEDRLLWEPDVPRPTRRAASWPVLPVHPWQASVLERRPEFAALLERGQLLRLGRAGEPVLPTSSVRTVYAPGRDLFIKLALDAKITNFVRNNPPEHLERSLTASRVVQRVARSAGLETIQFLPELAYRGIRREAWPAAAEHTASVSVLFRRGLHLQRQAAPVVVAALLEPAAGDREAPLAELLWTAARKAGRLLTPALVGDWVARYCDVAIAPLLAIYCRYGVSLEAHVQNALISLEEGWPSRSFIRDLEGTTLSRARARFEDIAAPTSAIWVDDDEAWQRLVYYVIVNHLSHLLAALAACGPAEEWQLWQVARGALVDAAVLQDSEGSAMVERVLGLAELPAKANWLSCFQHRSERPLYVGIENPLGSEESEP